jgi:hypothetical protein
MLEVSFKNPLSISVLSGDTQEVKHRVETENSISDDFLAGFGNMYQKECDFNTYMTLALLPDGPAWDSWTWNPRDPWVPYPLSRGREGDTSADLHHVNRATITWDDTARRWRLFYQWNRLASDFSLRAVGLFACDWYGSAETQARIDGLVAYPLYTVAVLPTAIPVKGRLGGTQVPDILQISYFFSVIGV